jgi:hypothetical protein
MQFFLYRRNVEKGLDQTFELPAIQNSTTLQAMLDV